MTMAPSLAPMTMAPDDVKVLPRQRQLDVVGQVAWWLDANVNDVKLCYLGASVDDVKSWVHFLKSFRQSTFEKIFGKKSLKNQQVLLVTVVTDVPCCMWHGPTRINACFFDVSIRSLTGSWAFRAGTHAYGPDLYCINGPKQP
jgi:hypothetical protein